MRQLVDIHNILYAESLSDFREELIRLGAYEPSLCEALLNRVLDSRYYWGRRDLFAALFESFQPYAMTAATHLTVPVSLIRFEGLAWELQTFCFM